jgi:hypothetical protein
MKDDACARRHAWLARCKIPIGNVKVRYSSLAVVTSTGSGAAPLDRERMKREWRAETGWFEWMLRELARYLFGVAILALVVFVPLQMKLSWLPTDAPPILVPSVVAILAVLAIGSIGVLGAFAYRAVWGDSGWVDREVGRRKQPGHRATGEVLGETRKSR